MLKIFDSSGKKSLKLLIKMIIKEKKRVILTLSAKGGVGKTTISWGLSKEYDLPYVTNDYGSILGDIDNKFYNNTYLIHNFIHDDFFINSDVIIIDFKGEGVNQLSKEELMLIKLASKIIIPTGTDEVLEHSGALKTALDTLKLNTNIFFITSKLPKETIEKNIESFAIMATNCFKEHNIPIYPLCSGGDIVAKAMKKDLSYRDIVIKEENKKEKEIQKYFLKDWDEITRKIAINR
jgi:cellulose biosynthesis protein BcsQ